MHFIARRYDNRELVEVSLAADARRVTLPLPSTPAHENHPWVRPGVRGRAGQRLRRPGVQFAGADAGKGCGDRPAALRLWRDGHLPHVHDAKLRDVLARHAGDCRGLRPLDRTFAGAVLGIHLEGPYFSTEEAARAWRPSQSTTLATPARLGRVSAAARGGRRADPDSDDVTRIRRGARVHRARGRQRCGRGD